MTQLRTKGTRTRFKLTCPDIAKDAVCAIIGRTGSWELHEVVLLQEIMRDQVERLMPLWSAPVVTGRGAATKTKTSLFLDVGANVGFFTFMMAETSTRVVAVEASPRNVVALTHTRCANMFSNVDIVPYAVGEQRGQRCVLTSHDTNINDYIVNCAVNASSAIGSDVGAKYIARAHLVMTTLDDLLATKAPDWRDYPVKVMKIDVEGFERQAMAGAKDLFTARKQDAPQAVLAEQWASPAVADFLRLMSEYGYVVLSLEPNGGIIRPKDFSQYHKSMTGLENFLFLRDDIAEAVLPRLLASRLALRERIKNVGGRKY